ncbi:MAG: hypothetical protein R2769_08520 [Saprospiraceae bacterium]
MKKNWTLSDIPIPAEDQSQINWIEQFEDYTINYEIGYLPDFRT